MNKDFSRSLDNDDRKFLKTKKNLIIKNDFRFPLTRNNLKKNKLYMYIYWNGNWIVDSYTYTHIEIVVYLFYHFENQIDNRKHVSSKKKNDNYKLKQTNE